MINDRQSDFAEAIRLVIWDLDETFWLGTLAEGGIEHYIQDHHDAVIELARRGIMSSICSKNDHVKVEEVLRARGIWDYFVFPSIDWSSKGARLAQIVEAIQLRPPTILFIDDNHGNRAEAADAVPGIHTADETIIPGLLEHRQLRGKADPHLSRLKQYKLLEEKSVLKAGFKGSNQEFLRQSSIRVRIEPNLSDKMDRVIELINRTNQLNFTKRRVSSDFDTAVEQLRTVLDKFDTRAGLVEVSDRFGSYGYCGFFLLSGHWQQLHLWHFAFSCRTLGMGIEQWVYNLLGRPRIEIVGEVLSSLDEAPDWINQLQTGSDENTSIQIPEVRIRGGCELEVLEHFFRTVSPRVLSEVVTVSGLHSIQRNNSGLLFQGLRKPRADIHRVAAELELSGDDLSTSFLDAAPDGALLIYSPSGDCFATIYEHKVADLLSPVFIVGYGSPAHRSSSDFADFVERQRLDAEQAIRVTRIKETLETDYDPIPVDDIKSMRIIYKAIVDSAPKNALLLVLLPNHRMKKNGRLVENARQLRCNQAFVESAAGADHVRFVWTSDLVDAETEVQDHFHHFIRSAYFKIFNRLRDTHQSWQSNFVRVLETST